MNSWRNTNHCFEYQIGMSSEILVWRLWFLAIKDSQSETREQSAIGRRIPKTVRGSFISKEVQKGTCFQKEGQCHERMDNQEPQWSDPGLPHWDGKHSREPGWYWRSRWYIIWRRAASKFFDLNVYYCFKKVVSTKTLNAALFQISLCNPVSVKF